MSWKGCLLAGIALLLAALLALGIFTITAGHFLAAVDAFSQADAIVVLGGDGGNFYRVQQGVDLFNESYVVTDLLHTRRAARTFRTLLPDITIYVSAAPIRTLMPAAGGKPRKD